MIPAIQSLSDADLREIGLALRSGRLSSPFAFASIQRYCSAETAGPVAQTMQQLADDGMKAEHLALLFESLAEAKTNLDNQFDCVDLVWTGPETAGIANRDTSVVARELFSNASQFVLVAGFAVAQGRAVFHSLAQRMETYTDLTVRLFLDVRRSPRDTSTDSEILRRFAHEFRTREWPNSRLPEIFYDPRSLDRDNVKRSSLHAKCIVIDHKTTLVSSANFTEAAQRRNIELGALIHSPRFATQVVEHFESLLSDHALLRLPPL
jgi:phosphatidylserine/phosphatidylglycerophosphate/cardiolipin synthase-like enzyme